MLGAKVGASPKELAQASDFIITMVVDAAQTEGVVFGEEGLWDGLRAGTVLIAMSTLTPQYVRELAQRASKKGVAVLDAAVSGFAARAEKGTLSIMVGGDEKIFEKCIPVFEGMGKNIFYAGGIGSGQVIKLVNNMLFQINQLGTLEGLRLGVKAGVDLDRLVEALKVSTGRSFIVEDWGFIKSQLAHYTMRGPSRLQKDQKLALELAKDLNIEMPVLTLVSELISRGRLTEELASLVEVETSR